MTSPLISNLPIEAQEPMEDLIRRCLELNHTLNNPLTGIIGYTEFLLSAGKNLTHEQRQHLLEILNGAERIQRAIAEMAEAKIRVGKYVNLRELLDKKQ